MSNKNREDLTTIQLPRYVREQIKKKKRGDESYTDFFKRRFRL